MIKSGNRRNGCVAFLLRKHAQDIKRRYWERFEPDYLTAEQKLANIEAYLQIEKDLGIKRGRPMTETGRYHIAWRWKRKRSGHIITAERLPDRNLRFYDPQNGMSGALDLYKKDIAGNVRIYRVDNLAPNANIVKDVLTKGETKAATGTAAQGGISGGIETKAIFERAKQIKSLVQRDGIDPIVLPTLNKTAEVSIKKVKEWCNQPHRHIAEKNELILHIRDIIAKAKYVGCGIDKHDHTCIAHLYEIEINGDPSWVVFREYRNGKMQLHGISDSPDIVKNVTKK